MKIHPFKSQQPFFDKERHGLKPNTVRLIDLNDERFLSLIAHNVAGYNKGDIQIEIKSTENPTLSFIRDIEDISIYNDLMIISWSHPIK